MVEHAVRDRYRARWGEPLREARFDAREVGIEISSGVRSRRRKALRSTRRSVLAAVRWLAGLNLFMRTRAGSAARCVRASQSTSHTSTVPVNKIPTRGLEAEPNIHSDGHALAR